MMNLPLLVVSPKHWTGMSMDAPAILNQLFQNPLLFHSPSFPLLSALPKVLALTSWCPRWLDSPSLFRVPVSTFVFIFRISTPSKSPPKLIEFQAPQNLNTLWELTGIPGPNLATSGGSLLS